MIYVSEKLTSCFYRYEYFCIESYDYDVFSFRDHLLLTKLFDSFEGRELFSPFLVHLYFSLFLILRKKKIAGW